MAVYAVGGAGGALGLLSLELLMGLGEEEEAVGGVSRGAVDAGEIV